MGWFDHSNTLSTMLGAGSHNGHKDAGYDSYDPAQIDRQIVSMVARGIDGAILSWKGPDRPSYDTSLRTFTDVVARAWRDRVEAYNTAHGASFEFIVQPDASGTSTFARSNCATTSSCTDVFVADLTYLYNTYAANRSEYGRFNNRPVIPFFDYENPSDPQVQLIDWDAVNTRVPGNPVYVFRNSSGFVYPDPPGTSRSGGAYAWVEHSTDPNYWAQDYLDRFYTAATGAFAGAFAAGSAFAGFDDDAAAWNKEPTMPRHCGRTWLHALDEVAAFYSPSRQLPALQLVTWNDYEEGTEIETGIDDCLSFTSAGVAQNVLSWSVDLTSDGSEDAVSAYRVYAARASDASQPDPPLSTLGEVAAPAHGMDLSCKLPPGDYRLVVRAVGQPSIQDHFSAVNPASGVAYTAP